MSFLLLSFHLNNIQLFHLGDTYMLNYSVFGKALKRELFWVSLFARIHPQGYQIWPIFIKGDFLISTTSFRGVKISFAQSYL